MDKKQEDMTKLKVKILTRYLIMAAEDKRFVSYAEIVKLLDIPLQKSGQFAGLVGDCCLKNKLPYVNALIISREGIPGEDWFTWYKENNLCPEDAVFEVEWCKVIASCIKTFHLKQDKKQKYSNTKKVK